ncbi:hypothetical protein [Eoetvoesiella caeni]|uniref:Uncharacterized protein n=1 Tax=Eoetvoesiella caeni TaxID=645616 RepID=A0A366HAJ5_9BURK|nr:hypothetical protein [Eoetvoesiella caeni]MCI2809342.1 hypothetical protein [Eoetvoesiella caeni]NYT54483.1 hypothetical protein [Eoetvoesiella caeni]RBP39329.1 hypothetical protein DFR37_105122 [Eoetvoesiella caeni]
MNLSTNPVNNSRDNPRPIHATVVNPAAQGSPVNCHPGSESSWVVIVIVIAAMLFMSWPIAFLFMELK